MVAGSAHAMLTPMTLRAPRIHVLVADNVNAHGSPQRGVQHDTIWPPRWPHRILRHSVAWHEGEETCTGHAYCSQARRTLCWIILAFFFPRRQGIQLTPHIDETLVELALFSPPVTEVEVTHQHRVLWACLSQHTPCQVQLLFSRVRVVQTFQVHRRDR